MRTFLLLALLLPLAVLADPPLKYARDGVENRVSSGNGTGGLAPVFAAIKFGINQNLATSPVLFGLPAMASVGGLSAFQIQSLQARAEAWFAQWFGIVFPPGPAPKSNGVFTLGPITVGYPYSVWQIYDPSKTFKEVNFNDGKNPTGVVLTEFTASYNNLPTNFTYGGTYGAYSLPDDQEVKIGDYIAYGRYQLTQQQGGDQVGCSHSCPAPKNVSTIINFRSISVTRPRLVLNGQFALADEDFQTCSLLWGPGEAVLQTFFPTGNISYYHFHNNHLFPGPVAFTALPAWNQCQYV